LHNEHIAFAHALLDLDEEVIVGKARANDATQWNIETATDLLR